VPLKPPQPLVPLALCAIGGIVAADWFPHVGGMRLGPWAAGGALLLALAVYWLRLNGRPTRATACTWGAAMLVFFAWHATLLTSGAGPTLEARIPPQGCVVQAVGIVEDEPQEDAHFQVRLQSLTLNGKTTPCNALILVRWTGNPPRYGDRVEMTGDLHHLEPPRNPGGFERPRIWHRRGVYGELRVRYAQDAHVLEHDRGSSLIAHSLALRHWMERTMALDIEDSPELVSLIQSMVLGSNGESLQETKKLFQYTGTMHLFAVSGMNVAMLAAALQQLLQVVGLRRRVVATLILPVLWIYCYATGLTASSLRATVMASMVLIGILLDRPALSWNTLAASVLAILAWDPNQFFTPGFQLSFGMVAFLLAFARPLQQATRRFTEPDPFLPRLLWSPSLLWRCKAERLVVDSVSVSAVAWLGSMPLTLYYFHLWSPSTIPANLFAVFLAWLMMILGMASVLAGAFWQTLAILFNNANWLIAQGLLWGISHLASVPGAHVFMEWPPFHSSPACEVETLDLPGGGALHIRAQTGGQRVDWMVDCGSANAFTYTVCPYLRSRGVTLLDGLLLTHGDAQHIGGTPDLLSELEPAEVIDSPLRDRSSTRKKLHAALEASGRGKTLVARGDALTLARGVVLRVLFPPPGYAASLADDKALVLRLDATGRRILLSSDAGFLTETWLLENTHADELRCDVWIKQRHHSDLSGTPEFLAATRPSVIIASGATTPAEADRDAAWGAEVRALGIRLLRQDATGAVHVTLDKRGKWTAEPFLPPTQPK